MDKQLEELKDFRVFVPITTDQLEKSVEVDANGDYIVHGVITSDDKDVENDIISPHGMDCTYFLEKGWIKYEHGKNPNQFIGEPLEVRVGQFEHPKLKKSVNGIYLKARLFHGRELARQAVQAIEDLQKSFTKRCMGWSIEGSVKERDRKTNKVTKSILRNVVLTMNPVNTLTWAELCKSFAKDHETVICMDEPLDKSMDIAGAAEVTPQSLEGAKKSKCKCGKTPCTCASEDEKLTKAVFRDFLTALFGSQKLQKAFVTGQEEAELVAYSYLLNKGLDTEEAEELASYIADKCEILKSLIKTGGEKMAGKNLTTLLDEDLENLQKAIAGDTESDEDEGQDDGDADNTDDGDADNEGGEGEGGTDDGDADNEGGEGDEDGEEAEKSIKTDLTKSLTEDEEVAKALDVAPFLTAIADEIGFSLDKLTKSIDVVSKDQNVLLKSMVGLIEVVKTQHETIGAQAGQIEQLQKSMDTIMQTPVGRRGVVNQREVQTLVKGMDKGGEGEGAPKRLTRMQTTDILCKALEAGEINKSEVLRYEGGVPLDALKLPDTVRAKVGLPPKQ